MAKKLERFIESEINRRWEQEDEARRNEEREVEIARSEGGILHMSNEFYNTVKNAVLKVAKNEQEAEMALDYIFRGVEIGETRTGGCVHGHGGLSVECDINTEKAYALARNTRGICKYLKTLNPNYSKPKRKLSSA